MSLHQTSEKYDVFVSFRGEDTRDNFTSHLYAELCRQNVETFIDNRLDRGEEISPALYRAIEESKIYVIILSEHYASSSWCLDELTEILKCKERYGREVIPVFYKVDPSNVRHQRHSYADDLVKHHQRFGDKVDAWKASLTQVAGISGWDSQKTSPESTLVTEIVKDIWKKLKKCFLSDHEGMAGIGTQVEKIESLLLLDLPTVRMIGIWGMGGIGKTTIASAIFEKLASQFSSKSIIRNVQQEIESAGLSHVKKEYLSQLLNERITSSESNSSHDRKLKRMKVLLVFDDVRDADQLKDLIGTHHKFGQGSRIIVTSRNKQVLMNASVDEIYQVREMNNQDSLQLFCSFAFKQNHPKESYVSLSEKVLDYAKGLPLALKVLGSLLYGKSTDVWESQLKKLKKLPDLNIFKVLKLSYDALDDEEKDIFLDIACFYKGEFKTVVEQTLDRYGFSTKVGMVALKDRSLISISQGIVWMHDLIQEMGHEIVRFQCVDDPGKHSRLWKASDVYDVLSKNKGTDAIRNIFLDMDIIKKVQLHPETFKKMHNLRMIRFNSSYDKSKVILPTFLESLPDDLKFLCWDGFPQRSLPPDFCPENLVILDMPGSHLEQLWEVDQDQALPNLKRLNLGKSLKLTRLPDLSLCPNIEEVILSDCVSLIQVYSSSFLDKLNWLCLDGCISLQSLDIRSNILWRSSGLVALHGCRNLQSLSINNRTGVVQSYSSPPFIQGIDVCVFYGEMSFDNSLALCTCDCECECEVYDPHWLFHEYDDAGPVDEFCWLDVSNCESLTCLPAELFNLKFLRRLSLSGCLKLEELPEIEETMVGLEELSLEECRRLKTIPSSIGNLSKLLTLNLAYCESLETFPSSIFKLKFLRRLSLDGCLKLEELSEIGETMVGLEELSLEKCRRLKTIPSSIGNLVKLLKLNLAYCESLETFPSIIFKLKLIKLNLQGCSMLKTFPEIPYDIGQFSSLTELSLQESGIINLPESIALLSRLRSLNLSDCEWLECIPKLPPHLKELLAFDCPSIKRVGLNSRLKFMSDFKDTFQFYLTNSQQLDVHSSCNIVMEARIMIIGEAYGSVIFCFPGSEIPYWFPYYCNGHSVIMNTYDPYWWDQNRLVGFALCAVVEYEGGMDDTTTQKRTDLIYTIRFESNGQTHFITSEDGYVVANREVRKRNFVHDHIFIWEYKLNLESIGNTLFHAHNFTIEIKATEYYFITAEWKPNSQSTVKVKECGICPLFYLRGGPKYRPQTFPP
ncbi:disease resistance protein RPV1 [Trifolium repens]|nr:disease resistance protein RPV1 [Trifolium repens]